MGTFFKIAISMTLIFSASCIKQTESITPLAKTQTLSELQQESLSNAAENAGQAPLSTDSSGTISTLGNDPSLFYLNVKYSLKNIDVFEVANMPNTFEQIGDSFIKTLAKLYLKATGVMDVELKDLSLTIPDLNIDRTVVKSIKIKKLLLKYNTTTDVGSDYLANFKFINSIELTRKINVPSVGNVDSLLFSYQKSRNFCLYKCLQFDILEDNILDILKPNSTIKLTPSLSIASMPDVTDLTLDGEIEMQIGLKLPF